MSETYSIKLPSGQVIDGVPVNIEPDQILAQYEKDRSANSQANQGPLNTARTAAGRAFTNMGRNVAGLVSEDARDASMEAERLDQDLLSSPGSLVGSVVGEGAALAAPASLITKFPLAMAAMKNAPWRTAAIAGAGAGNVASTPSTRTSGTIAGAVGGTAGHALARALGAAGKGVIGTRPAAKQYMEETGEEFIPLAKRAEPGSITGRLYRDVFPSLPFAGRKLIEQEDEAFKGMRAHMVKEATPEGQTVQVDPDDMYGTMAELDDVYQRAFGVVDDYVIKLADKASSGTLRRLFSAKKFHGIKPETLKLLQRQLTPDKDGVIPAGNIMQVRTDLLALAKSMDGPTKRALMNDINKLTDEVLEDLPPKDVKIWKAAQEKYPAYQTLAKTVQKNEGFSPDQLRNTAASGTDARTGAAGGGTLQREATVAADALGKEIGDPGFWRNMATLGMASGVAGVGAVSGPASAVVAALVLAGAPRAMAAKMTQKALLGDYAAQKALAKFVQENPQAAQAISLEISAMSGVQAGRQSGE